MKPRHVARDCIMSTIRYSYHQVNKKSIYNVKTACSSLVSDVDSSHLQVMRAATDIRKAIIPVRQTILNADDITINGYKPYPLIVSYRINTDLISGNFCFRIRMPTGDIDAKPL